MSSIEFLVLYVAVCITVVAVAYWFVRAADDSEAMGRETLPTDFDAQEIAFLRGDANELVRFAVFALTHAGFLELRPAEPKREPAICRTAAAPEGVALDPVNAVVYGFFDRPQTAAALFRSDVPKRVAQAFAAHRAALAARRLLTAPEVRAAALRARLMGLLVIGGLGAYRVWFALSLNRHNIGFTILIGVVALVALLLATRVPRLSRRGWAYLQALRAALPSTGWSAAPVLSPAFPVVVAAGGMAVLAGTPYAGLSQTFTRQAAAAGSSSCSGGCGSGGSSSCSGGGGDGGSGCGGGCGGGGD